MSMLSQRFCTTSRIKIAVSVAVAATLVFLCQLLIYAKGYTTIKHQLEVKTTRNETTTYTSTTIPKSQKYDNHERVVYLGEHPVCTREQIPGQVSPSCSAMRDSPAEGDITVNFKELGEEVLEAMHGKDLGSGGLYHPKNCTPNQKVAIIVPYRERPGHLKVLLNHLHPFLKKQKIEYMIIVVEQAPGSRFNRAMLSNIGFVEAEKICNFDCIIFHDVDLIPLREDNNYTCGDHPRHHAASLYKWNNILPYGALFGGVISFRKEQFIKVNGYSNMYFAWGGEDDDLYNRVRRQNMTITRYPMIVSRYRNLVHEQSKVNKDRCTSDIMYFNNAKINEYLHLIYPPELRKQQNDLLHYQDQDSK